MKLSEYIEANGLWEGILDAADLDFISYSLLDLETKIKYSGREVFPVFDDVSSSDFSNVVEALFASKWRLLISVELGAEDLFSEYSLAKNSTNNETGTTEVDGENANNTAAYNSQTLIKDSSTTNQTTTNETSNVIGDSLEYKKSIKQLFDNLKLVDRVNIIEIMIDDVVNYLTLNIYS